MQLSSAAQQAVQHLVSGRSCRQFQPALERIFWNSLKFSQDPLEVYVALRCDALPKQQLQGLKSSNNGTIHQTQASTARAGDTPSELGSSNSALQSIPSVLQTHEAKGSCQALTQGERPENSTNIFAQLEANEHHAFMHTVAAP